MAKERGLPSQQIVRPSFGHRQVCVHPDMSRISVKDTQSAFNVSRLCPLVLRASARRSRADSMKSVAYSARTHSLNEYQCPCAPRK